MTQPTCAVCVEGGVPRSTRGFVCCRRQVAGVVPGGAVLVEGALLQGGAGGPELQPGAVLRGVPLPAVVVR